MCCLQDIASPLQAYGSRLLFLWIIFYELKDLQRNLTEVKVKVKSSPTGHVGPEGSRRVKAPGFRDNGTVMVVGCQPYASAAFTPSSIPDDRKHTRYSFLLEAESTPEP